jgi:hypothetical protein
MKGKPNQVQIHEQSLRNLTFSQKESERHSIPFLPKLTSGYLSLEAFSAASMITLATASGWEI